MKVERTMERVYNKLVRDRIPEIITANDETPVTRILDDADYKKSLEEIVEIADEKREKRGGFEEKIFLEKVVEK